MVNENRTTRKKRKKRMRLPNGLGSVHLIGDAKSRRKPWRARVPSHVELDEVNGTAKQKYITIGYFENEADAIEALLHFRKNPYTLEAATCTFEDVFEMWKAKRFPDLSKASVTSYTAAFKQSESLHKMKMRDIRSNHLEQIMQTTSSGFKMQALIKTFWGQIFKYAIEHDIIQKNYAEFVKTRDKDEGTKRSALPPEDIAKIWQAIDEGDETAEIAMIYIYTGFRLTELLEIPKENVNLDTRIMIGGKKTAAGKDRHVPIHNCILPFIEKRMQTDGEWLFSGKGKKENKNLKGPVFSKAFDSLMQRLGLNAYTPHYMRHTFATITRQANIDEDIRKLILGHSSQNITDLYTHITDEMLVEAIDKLPGRE